MHVHIHIKMRRNMGTHTRTHTHMHIHVCVCVRLFAPMLLSSVFSKSESFSKVFCARLCNRSCGDSWPLFSAICLSSVDSQDMYTAHKMRVVVLLAPDASKVYQALDDHGSDLRGVRISQLPFMLRAFMDFSLLVWKQDPSKQDYSGPPAGQPRDPL